MNRTRTLIVLLAGLFLLCNVGQAAVKTLDIYFIDVEGGAATLIVTPTGRSLLIDTGFPGDRDAGRIAHVALEIAGLTQIDHCIITHWHRDHELLRPRPAADDCGRHAGGTYRSIQANYAGEIDHPEARRRDQATEIAEVSATARRSRARCRGPGAGRAIPLAAGSTLWRKFRSET